MPVDVRMLISAASEICFNHVSAVKPRAAAAAAGLCRVSFSRYIRKRSGPSRAVPRLRGKS